MLFSHRYTAVFWGWDQSDRLTLVPSQSKRAKQLTPKWHLPSPQKPSVLPRANKLKLNWFLSSHTRSKLMRMMHGNGKYYFICKASPRAVFKTNGKTRERPWCKECRRTQRRVASKPRKTSTMQTSCHHRTCSNSHLPGRSYCQKHDASRARNNRRAYLRQLCSKETAKRQTRSGRQSAFIDSIKSKLSSLAPTPIKRCDGTSLGLFEPGKSREVLLGQRPDHEFAIAMGAAWNRINRADCAGCHTCWRVTKHVNGKEEIIEYGHHEDAHEPAKRGKYNWTESQIEVITDIVVKALEAKIEYQKNDRIFNQKGVSC